MYQLDDRTAPISEAKTARKELRLKPSVQARIAAAAASVGVSETDFVTAAAYDRALEVERLQFHTTLPQAQFDALAAALKGEGRRSEGLAELARATKGILADG